jgi:hypothetical protein
VVRTRRLKRDATLQARSRFISRFSRVSRFNSRFNSPFPRALERHHRLVLRQDAFVQLGVF